MLDHLVPATSDLAGTAADLLGRGVPTVQGGQHVGVGTRNPAPPGTIPGVARDMSRRRPDGALLS